MLKQLGRLERTRNIIIVGFAVIMAVSLIFFYAPGRSARYLDPTRNTEVLAKVAGDEITVADLARLRENYQQMLGGQMSLAQLGGNKRFLDGLIRDRVIAQEAERLELAASDAEVAERIRKQFTDASGQFVGLERYKESIAARYGDVESFERNVRDAIAQEKLRAFVTSSVSVSDDEVQENYKREATTISLAYALLSPEKLAEKIQLSDEELRNYYEQHKTDYRLLEPQKKIRYVFISQEKAGAKLAISDKELREEFERLPAENKQAGVKVQQILLKVARKDLDQQVEEKAKELIKKARDASGKSNKDKFAELAKGNSEDPATAKNGGFLARPVKKNPAKPHGLYDRAVDMEPGDVSDIPIKYEGNWYILRRDDPVQQTFEEAKPTLLVSSRNRRSFTVAANLATKAQTRLKETKDPKKVAQELAAEANMNPAEMVRETPYIKPGDDVPEIGSNQQFESVIAPLNNPNDVGDSIGVKGGFAIPMFVDKKEPRIPELEEIKDKISQTLKQQRATEQLEQKATEIASSVKSVADIKSASEAAGFEAGNEEDWKVGSVIGKAGTSPALDEAAYALKAGDITRTPIKVGENWVILGATNRVDADLAAFASRRAQMTQTLLSERQTQLWDDYITKVQEDMKRAGKIKIYNDVLASLEEDEPAAAAPQSRFPFPTK
ncbi:MAG TPA: SurA N-terminal domain-containing protein [Pyrinomonadaceae bacterium]|nr:SurA N-terminal domain-containing protein [Pyrinomonadaceae bacterium]